MPEEGLKLKPCPKCGSEDLWKRFTKICVSDKCSIQCNRCDFKVEWNFEDQLKEAWNGMNTMPDLTRKESGYCSAHRHGEDKSCKICYPPMTNLTAEDEKNLVEEMAKKVWINEQLHAKYSFKSGQKYRRVPLRQFNKFAIHMLSVIKDKYELKRRG